MGAGFSEYSKRMPPEAQMQLIEIKPEKRSSAKNIRQVLEAEKKRILAALPRHCWRVVLDERGKTLSTAQLAQSLARWMAAGRDVGFVIGGADGLENEVKTSADMRLSLSALTLPHALARVVLAEQLYRALSLLHNHPYHRQ
ncbi:MAG: 23S rRNA (pseudouridine(1915)-N(3))-methyltransferase RlmH [Burkholderiales bacterium]